MNLCYKNRFNAQLEGISHCLKSSLSSSTDSPFEYIVNGRVSALSSDHPGLVIGTDQCLTLKKNNGSWLKVAPLAPGGLFCDNLLIQSDCNSFSALHDFIKYSDYAAKSTCTMTPEQFHSRFRPGSQGHSLLSDRSAHRLLVMMPDVTDSDGDNLLIEELGSLLETLITAPGKTSIECIYSDGSGASQSQELLALLKTRTPAYSRLGMTTLNADRQNMLAALLGNASLVLCGHSGHLADAFQFGLPVFLWNSTGSIITDSINNDSVEWFRNGCQSSKSMIVRQQQELWLRTLTTNRSAITIANKSRHLRCIVEHWLNGKNHPVTTGKVSLEGPEAGRSRIEKPPLNADVVMPSAFSPIAIPSTLEQLRFSLERKHKKFVKFRHSPARFIEDSEVRWLRAFKHLRS